MILNVMKSRRKLFSVAAFLLYVTCLTFSWVLIQPPYGVSDEPSHTIKAVASAYGQFDRPQVAGQFGYGAYQYDVPKVFASLWHFTCYNDDTRISAACAGDLPGGKEAIATSSTAGSYPPTYYLAVGWLGRLVPTQAGFYLMRFFSALLFCLMLTFAFVLQISKGQARNAWVSILLLLTPAVSAFSAVINPFAHEIAAAALFWTSAILLTGSNKSNKESRNLWLAFIVSAFFFSSIRPAAFIWMTVIVLFVIFSSPGKLVSVIQFSERRIRQLAGIILNALIISIALTFRSRTDPEVNTLIPLKIMVGPGGDLLSNMLFSYRRLGTFFQQLFGYFGWTSFYPPVAVPMLFVAAVVVSMGVMKIPHWRVHLGLLALMTFVYFAPVVLEGARASHAGFDYQGRYLLPVAIGIPIFIWLRGEEREPNRYTLLLTRAIVALCGGTSIFTANYVARRFISGTDGRILWFLDVKWSPPGGVYVTLGLLIGAMIGVCLLTAIVVSDYEATPQMELVDSVQSR